MDWDDFKKRYLGEEVAEFSIDFAWSVATCLIDGYPQNNPDTCITLMDACKKHNVKVDITSEESGVGFEEHITCSNKGEITNECFDMPTYKCKCGNEQHVASYEKIKDIVCCECDECGLGEVLE